MRKRNYVYKKFEGQCYWCGIDMTEEDITLDHAIPKSKGGTYRNDNLILSCKECNEDRGNMDFDKYYLKQIGL